MKFVFIMFLYKIISQISCSEYFDLKKEFNFEITTMEHWLICGVLIVLS